MTNKFRTEAYAALRSTVRDGMTIAVGGFGLSGVPTRLITALRDTGVKDLTIVSNNMGVDGKGLGLLLENGQVSKVMASYVGENRLFAQKFLNGELEVEFAPQGTLAERLRAGGFGIPGFYTPTGAGTPVAEGKQVMEFEGRPSILELGIVADVALVRAHRADCEGNLNYRMAARNFNPLVAAAGRLTLAEAETIEDDYLEPSLIDTPGIFVQRVFQAHGANEIEKRTVRTPQEA